MPQPPTKTRRRLQLAAVLLVLLVPLFLAVPTHLRQDPLIGPLADRYHVGLFLVLTVLLYRFGPLRGRPLAVILFCLALGVVTELLQLLAGRSAAVWDWYQDALGVGFGACWIWWRRTGHRTGPVVAVVLLLGLVAWPLRHLPTMVAESRAADDRFPLLDDFERPGALALWSGHQGGAVDLVMSQDHGQVLQMTSDAETRWPGVTSRDLPWDWTGQHTLRLECRLREPAPEKLRLFVWIEDRAGRFDSDYILADFDVGHEWTTFEVSLTETLTRRNGRHLALGEIRAIAVFVSRKDAGAVALQVNDLRLEGG